MYRHLTAIRRLVYCTLALVLTGLALAPISWGFLNGIFSPVGHVFGVALLSLAIAAFLRQEYAKSDDIAIQALYASMVSACVWLIIEMTQAFLPKHGTEISDVWWDFAGFLLGLLVVIVERVGYLHLRKVLI